MLPAPGAKAALKAPAMQGWLLNGVRAGNAEIRGKMALCAFGFRGGNTFISFSVKIKIDNLSRWQVYF